MAEQYTLNQAYNPTYVSWVPVSVDEFANKWVGQHYLIAFALLLLLVIIVIWLLYRKAPEKFNPTATMRMQQRDGTGEGAEGGPTDRGKSVFAQQVQDQSGATFTYDPNAAANQPGSLAWQVLHSKDFDCNKRQLATTDAWSWMEGVAKETAQGGLSDNDFSRISQGH